MSCFLSFFSECGFLFVFFWTLDFYLIIIYRFMKKTQNINDSLARWPIHPQNTNDNSTVNPSFPRHILTCATSFNICYSGDWKAQSWRLKWRRKGWRVSHGTSPTLGAPLRYYSRVDTIALKFKLQQTIRKESNQNMINDGILLLFEK